MSVTSGLLKPLQAPLALLWLLLGRARGGTGRGRGRVRTARSLPSTERWGWGQPVQGKEGGGQGPARFPTAR